ncbi:MAG: DoxX family protein [Microbacteriaceae bacterium]|nr:MAG: DoxX family protein [Microbacteriaceae bacterium]
MNAGRLIVRVVVGGLFFGHGMQKLAGWFGGSGLEGTDKMMHALDMEPARRNSIASGLTEAAGGAALIAGLATPVAAAGLMGTMITAVRKVHFKNGVWNGNRGWEYNAVLIASLFALVESGPGRFSLDAARGRVRSGTGCALAALAGGVAASVAAVGIGRRNAQAARLLEAHDATAHDAQSPDDAD